MRRVFALALLVGCGFEHGALDHAGVTSDGGSDTDAKGGDGSSCSTNFLDLCAQTAPTTSLDITSAQTIDTDTDPRCRVIPQTTGREVCLLYATSISISAAGSLTAHGGRPLALGSTSTVTIDGIVDVSSRRTDGQIGAGADDTCSFTATPEDDAGGAGGAAGGSYAHVAGNGGRGDTDMSLGADGDAAPGGAGPVIAVTRLRGGCRGQTGGNESATGNKGGTGGHSGGALYVYAATDVTLSGVIRAMGAGGEGGAAQAGGGGGGSGGLVVIEAPSITISGQISANGGGGGEGGARVGTTDVSGQPGTDGGLGTTPAPGGMGSDNRFGYGGAGGAGTTDAVVGTSSVVGGGGGGGGVGYIQLRGSSTVSGSLSPPAT